MLPILSSVSEEVNFSLNFIFQLLLRQNVMKGNTFNVYLMHGQYRSINKKNVDKSERFVRKWQKTLKCFFCNDVIFYFQKYETCL